MPAAWAYRDEVERQFRVVKFIGARVDAVIARVSRCAVLVAGMAVVAAMAAAACGGGDAVSVRPAVSVTRAPDDGSSASLIFRHYETVDQAQFAVAFTVPRNADVALRQPGAFIFPRHPREGQPLSVTVFYDAGGTPVTVTAAHAEAWLGTLDDGRPAEFAGKAGFIVEEGADRNVFAYECVPAEGVWCRIQVDGPLDAATAVVAGLR
jgi:hypothetical protein